MSKAFGGETCEIFPNTFLSVIGIIRYVPFYPHGITIIPALFWLGSQIPSLLNSIWVNDILLNWYWYYSVEFKYFSLNLPLLCTEGSMRPKNRISLIDQLSFHGSKCFLKVWNL